MSLFSRKSLNPKSLIRWWQATFLLPVACGLHSGRDREIAACYIRGIYLGGLGCGQNRLAPALDLLLHVRRILCWSLEYHPGRQCYRCPRSQTVVGDKLDSGNTYPEADNPHWATLTYWPLFRSPMFGTTSCSLYDATLLSLPPWMTQAIGSCFKRNKLKICGVYASERRTLI